MSQRVPTTIFTGFLGSGKTTIISHLVEQLQARGEQVAYIKNEIGDSDVDTELMRGKNILSKELLNGCICCTLVGPFVSSVTEIIDTYHPDRIIIEASGTADPVALALMVSSHPLLKRDGVISVIDVINFEGFAELTTTAQEQTKFTDLILFNKVELVDQARKEAVVGYVRELNQHSPILEAPEGKVDARVIFGLHTSDLEQLLTAHQAEDQQHPEDQHYSHHLSDDQLQGFDCPVTQPVELAALQTFLEQLPKRIFRVKGFVHDTQQQYYLVNSVAGRVDFQELAPLADLSPKLVFIGYLAQELEPEICQQLQQLQR